MSTRVLGGWTAAATLAAGVAYLLWRVIATRAGTNAAAFWVLLSIEALAWIALALLVTTARVRREIRACSDAVDRSATALDVTVVVVVRHESPEVVTACLTACLGLPGTPDLMVVDGSGRPEVAHITSRLGISVSAVPLDERDGPEAALFALRAELRAPLVAVVPAEVVPLPALVTELPRHLDRPLPVDAHGTRALDTGDADPVWAVQGLVQLARPGRPSVESDAGTRPHPGLAAGRDHRGAALWEGAGGLLRREALDRLAGGRSRTAVATSVRAMELGWRCAFVPTPTALRFAGDTHDLDGQSAATLRQRVRLLRSTDSPLRAHLGTPQRGALVQACSSALAGPLRLAAVAVLVATLVGGALPLTGNPAVVIAFCAAWWVALDRCRAKLLDESGPPLAGASSRWRMAGLQTAAWLGVGRPTHRGATSSTTDAARKLPLALAACTAAATLARAAAAAGHLRLPDLPGAATTAALVIGAATTAVLGSAAMGSPTRRRRGARFPIHATASVGGIPHNLVDLSESGVAVALTHPVAVGTPLVLTLCLPALDGRLHTATAAAEVRWVRRSARTDRGTWEAGMAFTHLSSAAEQLIRGCCEVLLPAVESLGDDREQWTVPTR